MSGESAVDEEGGTARPPNGSFACAVDIVLEAKVTTLFVAANTASVDIPRSTARIPC
jgi:hypothetical protein